MNYWITELLLSYLKGGCKELFPHPCHAHSLHIYHPQQHTENSSWRLGMGKGLIYSSTGARPDLRITLCYQRSLSTLPVTSDIVTYIYYTQVYLKSINTELFCWILLQFPRRQITFLLLARDTWVQLCSTTRALLTLLGTMRSWTHVCKIRLKRQSKSTGSVNEQMPH